VLIRIFGPQRVKVTGGYRKYRGELHNFFSFPNVFRMIKSSIILLVGHVEHMGRKGNICTEIWQEN
jgi:hypothetical protein